MEEIEIKILEINKDEVVKKLEKLGAKKIFDGDMCAVRFDYPNNEFEKQGKLIRLRKKAKKVELTYKERIPNSKAKSMQEFGVFVSSFEGMEEILKGIGFVEHGKIEKNRITYKLGDVHFEIDTMSGIPTFLEIEAPILDLISFYVKKLGFQENQVKPWSVKDVIEYYAKK